MSGFSQKTCLPARIAAAQATAWLWSGVATVTASISLSISPSITRKSAKVFGRLSTSRFMAAPAVFCHACPESE